MRGRGGKQPSVVACVVVSQLDITQYSFPCPHPFSLPPPTLTYYLQIAELKDSITASAAAATGSSQAQQEMEEQKLALAAIMEVASATKRQLQEEVKQRTEAISQLRIMAEEEGNP